MFTGLEIIKARQIYAVSINHNLFNICQGEQDTVFWSLN